MYAKEHEVHEGTKLCADDGFTCLEDGDIREAKLDEQGRLFIDCSAGRHDLAGQLEGDDYIGLTLA